MLSSTLRVRNRRGAVTLQSALVLGGPPTFHVKNWLNPTLRKQEELSLQEASMFFMVYSIPSPPKALSSAVLCLLFFWCWVVDPELHATTIPGIIPGWTCQKNPPSSKVNFQQCGSHGSQMAIHQSSHPNLQVPNEITPSVQESIGLWLHPTLN